MSKYDLKWNEQRYEKKIKEGHGQGYGKDYKPWVTVHDFPSDGFASRTPGWKTSRVHHFMSTNELRYFYLLEWSDLITDIREQYPLDPNDTLQIAEELQIKHPTDNASGFPYTLTSDFMVTMNIQGKEAKVVRTIKPAKELEKNRTLEKYEIERRYWLKKGIDWGITTDSDIPKIFAANIEWVHTEYYLEAMSGYDVNQLLSLCEILKEKLNKFICPISKVTTAMDKEYNLETGTSLTLFKHLIAHKEVVMDMHIKISGSSSTQEILKIIDGSSKVSLL